MPDSGTTDLRQQIDREVRAMVLLPCAVVDYVLEKMAQECEATVMLGTEQACNRARELRAAMSDGKGRV